MTAQLQLMALRHRRRLAIVAIRAGLAGGQSSMIFLRKLEDKNRYDFRVKSGFCARTLAPALSRDYAHEKASNFMSINTKVVRQTRTKKILRNV